MQTKDVPPGAFFVEQRRLPGTSGSEGELRRNHFQRTDNRELVMVNGMECVEVLSFGFTQEQVRRLSDTGVKCRLIATTPVQIEDRA